MQITNQEKSKIKQHLDYCYSAEKSEKLIQEITDLVESYAAKLKPKPSPIWSEKDITMITYGNSISKGDIAPLSTLHQFAKKYLNTISCIHILPHFPYSSDEGFSVIDYYKINEELGSWSDIEALGQDFDLMVDMVINHTSRKSRWIKNFQKGRGVGHDYFIVESSDSDLSKTVRPRNTPLLTPIETHEGEKLLWATFGPDQIDLDFKNPKVLLQFIDIFLFYLSKGYRVLRLDAIAFLWKTPGTSCIHLAQAHEIVKLFRTLCDIIDENRILITETNVPNRENLSYFGNRNEAHMVYNFSLPPLMVYSLLKGDCTRLKAWMMSMPPSPQRCAYFNFLASHDGIGLRPLEGLIDETETRLLLDTMKSFGGEISYRQTEKGEKPYEINISFFDALKGTFEGLDEYQIQRFICAQTIMMSIEGVPAFYIHSLLATPNDREHFEKSNVKRDINRARLDLNKLETELGDQHSNRHQVFTELIRLITIRKKQEAFHPNATQFTLQVGTSIFGFWRQNQSRDQSIFSLHNLSNQNQSLRVSNLNLVEQDVWHDLILDQDLGGDTIELKPYQSMWITNKW